MLVFGLILLCAIPAYSLPRKFRGSDVLDEVPLIDGHNDLPINIRSVLGNQLNRYNFSANLSTDPIWSHHTYTDLPRLRAGKVGGQFWVAYTGCDSQYKDSVEQTLEQIDVIKRLIQRYPNDMQFVTTADGIWDAFKAGKIGSLIGIEGGHSIDSRLAVLRLLYEMGARYLTLTHSCNNPWADASPVDVGSLPPTNGGLSEFGKLVVKEMNRLGMMVDISHVSHDTMADVLRTSQAPVIFSHSSAYSICNHHRNPQDDILKMLKENGGIVMVNFYPKFIVCEDRQATTEDVVAHINYIRNLIGVEYVGIGSDFDGIGEAPKGLDDVSKYPVLFDRLAESIPGEPVWSPDDLKKLAGLNLIRVFKDVEKIRDQLASEGMTPIDTLIDETDISNNTGCYTDFLAQENKF